MHHALILLLMVILLIYYLKENLIEKKNQSLYEDLQIDNVETEGDILQGEVNKLAEKVSIRHYKHHMCLLYCMFVVDAILVL